MGKIKAAAERFLQRLWYRKNIYNYCLLPLTWVYWVMRRLDVLCKSSNSCNSCTSCSVSHNNIKVIVVGGVTIGGSGKTPAALAVADVMHERGWEICFVPSCYKSKIDHPRFITASDRAECVGDEALILAKRFKTVIARSRVGAMKFACSELSKTTQQWALICDDGLHDPRIKPDISFCVVDARYKFGNEMLLPAGPMRDTFDFYANRIDFFLVIHGDLINGDGSNDVTQHKFMDNKQTLNANIESTHNLDIKHGEEVRLVCFCSIAIPEKFFTTVESMFGAGAILRRHTFPDHYLYKKSDIDMLKNEADELGAKLITTEKDWVKILDDQIYIVEISVKLECALSIN